MSNHLKIERIRLDVTQKELAYMVGVSQQTICKWETEIASCPAEKLIELIKIFGCSVDYLIGLVDERGGIFYEVRNS